MHSEGTVVVCKDCEDFRTDTTDLTVGSQTLQTAQLE